MTSDQLGIRICHTDYMKVGDTVAWKWGVGLAQGQVTAINPKRTQISSKGKLITRNGTAQNPAIIIRQATGTEVLKLASEVRVVD